MSACVEKMKEYLKSNFSLAYERFQLVRINIQHDLLVCFAKENKRLMEFKDIHKGESCFIVATGPSLTIEDLELLNNHICFSVNSIIRVFDNTSWRPDYLCITDAEAWSIMGEELQFAQKQVKQFFVSNNCKRYVDNETVVFQSDVRPISYFETAFYNRTKKISPKYDYYISKNMDRYFCDGPTVIYSVIQLAMYMGFENIYLLGNDCGISGRQVHSRIIESQTSGKIDTSQLGKMLYAYEVLAQELNDKYENVNVINVTRGGNLEAFPREELEKVLEKIEKRNNLGV